MRERVRAAAATAAWVSVPLVAIAVLHRLGDIGWMRVDLADPGAWLRRSSLEEALTGLLRLAGLLGGYWLAGSTALYLAARISRLRSLIRFAGAVTLPAVRRAADRLVVGSLAVSTLVSPLGASARSETGPGDPYVPEPYRQAADVSEDDTRPRVIAPSELPPAWADAADDPAIHVRLDAALEVVVRPGDHLWSLAERRLSEALGRPAADHEVAPYWRDVVEANRSRIRSGDPDLIRPGEVIVLPSLEG